MSRSVLITAATAAALGGCAANFATQQRPTGEPLSAEWVSTFRQGKTPIDEQDFYTIAGDREARSTIEHTRAKGITANRVGLALALVGLAGLIGGATVDSKLYGGAIFLPIGGVTAYWGKLTAEKRPHLSIDHARQMADRYNASLSTRGDR